MATEADARSAPVRVIEAPTEVIQGIQRSLGDLGRYATEDAVKEALNSEECRTCREKLGQWAAGFGEVMKDPVVRINSPGLWTVTRGANGREYIGMHVDNWYGHDMDTREASPNRLCVNIGVESRYLLYINVPMTAMLCVLKDNEGAPVDERMLGTPIGLAFMEVFPDFPVIRLRVDPGEAYIAPTENMVHDGSTEGMRSWDLSASILGRFAF